MADRGWHDDRDRLKWLKSSETQENQIEIIPGPGFVWDPVSGSLKREVPARLLASSVPGPTPTATGLSRRLEQVRARAKAKGTP